MRHQATFLWSISSMIGMLNSIQTVAEAQALRVILLTDAESAATSDMAAITYCQVLNASATSSLQTNTQLQTFVTNYQAQRSVIEGMEQQISSYANDGDSALEDQATIINSFITTVDTLIQGIFKKS